MPRSKQPFQKVEGGGGDGKEAVVGSAILPVGRPVGLVVVGAKTEFLKGYEPLGLCILLLSLERDIKYCFLLCAFASLCRRSSVSSSP